MTTLQIEQDQRRDMALEYAQVGDAVGVLELSFSSEYPVQRHFGIEILDHSPTSADLSRVANGGCPLLMNHEQSKLIGVVEKAWIDGATKKGRAIVRFGSGEEALEALQNVNAKILNNVSCWYKIRSHEESYGDGASMPTVRITRWELVEISLVSCPEDPTVGVGRSAAPLYQATVLIKTDEAQRAAKQMEVEELQRQHEASLETATRSAAAAERDRIKLIQAMGTRYGDKLPGGSTRATQLVEQAIEGGLDEQASRALFADEILSPDHKQQSISRPAPQLDFSAKDQRTYSVARALRAAASRAYPELSTEDCGFELECSRAIAASIGANPKGLFIPVNDLLISGQDAARGAMVVDGKRATFQVGTSSLGGATVETALDTTRMVDYLFNMPRTKEAGMTMLMGLQGNVQIPTEDGTGLGITWVPEDGPIAETNTSFGLLGLNPKTAGAYMRTTQRLLMQSELSMEAYMRSRLQIAMGIGIDNAVLFGTGLNNQPTGILNTAGISSVSLGANGGVPTYDALVLLEEALGNANMDQLGGSPIAMLNAKGRSKLRRTLQNNISGATYLWEQGGIAGDGDILGYRALTSNQVPSNLTKGTGTNLSALILGYWNTVFWGQWGIVDVLANPYADYDFVRGAIKIRIMTTLDVLVSRAKSFAVFTDMITA